MKYTLQWTDANGKCWHLTRPFGKRVIMRKLMKLMPAVAPVSGKHATIITINLSAK